MFSKKLAAVVCLWVGLAGASNAATVRSEVNFSFGTPYYGANYDFDIDADGTDDLRLRPYYSSYSSYRSSGRSSGLTVIGLNGTLIRLGGPLAFGETVDGTMSFGTSQSMIGYRTWSSRSCSRWSGCRSSSGRDYFGEWTNGDTSNVAGFLGLELNGNRYGWAELDLRYIGSGTLLSFGFETVSGDAISAGAEESVARSGSLSPVPLPGAGFLLLGGLAVLAARRRM